MFSLIKSCKTTKARTGYIQTDHGRIETPIFMPVGTLATVKAVPQKTLLSEIKAQIILANTYHLYLRPGMQVMDEVKGLHSFMRWDRPILTDSGGYQVFSLSDIRKIEERGVIFKSHLDGSKHEFTPENVVDIQRTLGSDIIMVLDECPDAKSTFDYAKKSMELTHRWAKRGRDFFLTSADRYDHRQFQFGIVQGTVFSKLREESSQTIADLDFEGNAIGGLSVGEPTEDMYAMTDICTDILPTNKPRYLMGVGTPANLIESIARGIDMFDCVMPTRNARNGMIFTHNGTINLRNSKWKHHHKPFDDTFPSDLCSTYPASYIHHLFRSNELYGLQLASEHNLMFYLALMEEVRQRILNDSFSQWYPKKVNNLECRI